MPDNILVADDDENNRVIMKLALARAGYTVLLAKDGKEALDMIERERPALVLMDLSMPVLTGWEAVRQMKANEHLRDIPVFAFTAHAIAGDESRAREAGCDGYLSKPCTPHRVVEVVAQRLQQRAAQGQARSPA